MKIGCGTSYWICGDNSFNIRPGAGIRDKDGDLGSAGQVLSSTGTQLNWIDAGGGGAWKCIATMSFVTDGTCSGCNLNNGDHNIAAGDCAGRDLSTGDGNVFLGRWAGCKVSTGGCLLYTSHAADDTACVALGGRPII